jgi:hypothetical protein
VRCLCLLLTVGAALLSGCSEKSPEPTTSQDDTPSNRQGAPASAPSASARPSESTGEPQQEFGGQTAEDAAAVVRSYYELVAAGRYGDAWQLRWHEGNDAPPEFGASFADYAELRVTVGTPSRIQGAAGSLYVEVPVQLFGRHRNGAPFSSAGTVTLRRSNNIPGATPDQLRWRIYAND